MGKALGAIVAVGVTLATAGAAAPFISGAIVGIGGGTFAAAGLAATLTPFLSIGIGALVGQTVGGIIAGSPNIPKPDTAATAIKTSRPERVSAYGECRLYGAYILYETAGNGTACDIYAVHEGRLTEITGRYLNDDQITLVGSYVSEGADGRYGDNKLTFVTTDGSTPGTPISNALSLLPSIWTSAHRGDGVVLIGLFCSPVSTDDFLEVYPNGVPTPSLVAKWQRCPDPFVDDPTDESGWTWTENPIRHLMHYKMVREGVDYASKIAPTITYWREAAAVCDEAVPLKAGGAEARWRSCLSHKHTQKHGEVTGALLATCDGWIAPRADGALVVYAGKYYAPTISIGPEDIVAYDWSYGVDDDEAVNELICSYVSADHDFNTVECDAWRDEDDIAERGRILSDSLEPQVRSWGQVRRLAKRRMARINASFRGTVTTNVAGRRMRGQRYIHLTLRENGTEFYVGPVEVTAVTRNIATGGVTFSWVSASPAIDEWNPATEEGDPAAKGDRIAPEPLETPSILTATPSFYGYGAQINLSVDGPDRPDITWYVRWKVSTDATWTEQSSSDLDPGTPVSLNTPIVPLEVDIDVAVAYSVGDGRTSDWSATETVDTTPA